MGDDKTADAGPNDRTDLKYAVVPQYRIRKSISRYKGREKRTARGPAESAHRPVSKEQKVNYGNRSIIEMEAGIMRFEDRRDGAQSLIPGAQNRYIGNDKMFPGD